MAERRPHVRVRDLWPGAAARDLPPGQRELDVFPHFSGPILDDVSRFRAIAVRGSVTRPLDVSLDSLAGMRRQEIVADFHCVAGWTARGLRWGGVPFRALYEELVQPVAPEGISHLRFIGKDGWRSVLLLEDALRDDVLLADHLDGEPLGAYHGGPIRLISPSQYGYKSTKYLTTIELHTEEPSEGGHPNVAMDVVLRLVKAHPRARVDLEERHRYLPPWAVGWVYSNVARPLFAFIDGQQLRRGGMRSDR